MRWTDIIDIAIELNEKHPNFNVSTINFTNLRNKVLELEGFKSEPNGCNEKILEAIQQAWLDEQD